MENLNSTEEMNEELKKRENRKKRKIRRMEKIILEAAKEFFTKKLYNEVSMEEIADQAALSRGTLYNYFPNKDAIYFELGIQGWKNVSTRLKTLMSTEHSGLDQILLLIKSTLVGVLENPLNYQILTRFRVINNEAKVPTEELLRKIQSEEICAQDLDAFDVVRVRYLQEILAYEAIWEGGIQKGQEDGSIRSDLNPSQLAHFIFMIQSGMVDQLTLHRIPLAKINLSIDHIIEMTLELIQRYMKK